MTTTTACCCVFTIVTQCVDSPHHLKHAPLHAIHKQTIEKFIRCAQTAWHKIFIAKFIQMDFHLSSVRTCVCECRVRAYLCVWAKLSSHSLPRSCVVLLASFRPEKKLNSWNGTDFYWEIVTSMCSDTHTHKCGDGWWPGCTNLREHLFASSHEADIYTHLCRCCCCCCCRGVFFSLLSSHFEMLHNTRTTN